ncbi:MAG: hypothetical protein AAGF12_13625 [Myxococcota bacterium]
MSSAWVGVLLLFAGGCQGSTRTQLVVDFQHDEDRRCLDRVQLLVFSGGCGDPNSRLVLDVMFDLRDTARPIRTLAPGRYSFRVVAIDQRERQFAEGCTEVVLPQDEGGRVVVRVDSTMASECATRPGPDASVPDGSSRDAMMPADAMTEPVDAMICPTDISMCPPELDPGGADPCAADVENARCTVCCNGAVSPVAEYDEFGGHCEKFEFDGQGTCWSAELGCVGDHPTNGICAFRCPLSSTFASTGDCPLGSRCIDIDTGPVCLKSCFAEADCGDFLDCGPQGFCVPID